MNDIPPCPENWEPCEWCGAQAGDCCSYLDRDPTDKRTGAVEEADPVPLEPVLRGPSTPFIEEDGPYFPDTFGGLDDEEAKHFDTGKPDLTLIDPHFMRTVASALGYGAQKYSVDNWRKGSSYRRYMASTLRHLEAFLEGEDLDPESGHPHLAHAACNIMFVMCWVEWGNGKDDRFPPKK